MLNKYLGQLLSDHHIEYTEVDGKYQIADGITISAEASVGKAPDFLPIQGDYILQIGHREIVESFSIPGSNAEVMYKEMTDYFAKASFHVMMSYVFGTEYEQNNYQEWNFQGTKRKMIIGPVNSRFSSELTQKDIPFSEINVWAQDYIQSLKMNSGLNWVRVYIFQFNGELKATELLINNSLVPEFNEYFQSKPFTKTNGFYSYRNFMIIREDEDFNENNGAMPRDELILEILRMADENPRLDNPEFLKFIALHSDDPQRALLGFGFFQAGLFRRVKNKLGRPFSEAHLSEDYLIADAEGMIIESGKLIDQEWYKAAFSVPEYCISPNNVIAIAMTASEANGLFSAFKKGEKVGELSFGPVIQFSSTPTESGLAKVQSLVVQKLKGQKKPWWKFW
jgi:hypothetical protein